MSLTRKMLKAMGIEEDKADQIIEAHMETVDALRKERDGLKEGADEADELRKQNADLKKQLEEASGGDDWKTRYTDEHKAFEAYKQKAESEKVHGRKAEAYRKLLSDAGIAADYLDDVMRVSDVDAVELGEDGVIAGADDLIKQVSEKWRSFIPTTRTKGANVPTPPANNGGAMSKDDIMAIKDTAKRQQAIADNIELFRD